MPINIDILFFECFNQLRNGVSFNAKITEKTPNLVGNVGEKIRISQRVSVGQSAFTEGLEEWEVLPDRNEIRRATGDFRKIDRIQKGDKFDFYTDWENRDDGLQSRLYTGQVNFISSDGRTLRYDVLSGDDSTFTGTKTNVGLLFDLNDAANLNTALFTRFGLLNNDETFNFISKTTENQQIYYGELTEYYVEMLSLGKIKDWVTGRALCRFLPNLSQEYEVIVSVIHDFYINPFYTLALREFIDAGTIPELYAGDNSLKYSYELDVRKTLTDLSSSKTFTFNDNGGFVGWYGENFNGLNNLYNIVSVDYEDFGTGDPLDAININTPTKITIVVENKDLSPITDYSCGVYVFRVPQSEGEYIGTETNLLENFLYKSFIVSSPATTGTDITTSIVSGQLVIEVEVSYTTAEKLRLTTDDEFFLSVQIENPTISVGNSDRTMLQADLRNYVDIDYVSEFLSVPQHNYLTFGGELGVTLSTPNIETSNEDGILLDAVLEVDPARDVVINSVSVALVAYNAVENNSFELDRYNLPVTDPVFIGGSQKLDVQETRGYLLPDGDQFNLVVLENGNPNQYILRVGQKITWQDWIENDSVDDVFFEATKPNNNLNEKASNYSAENGYDIHLAIIVNISGKDDLGRTLSGDAISYGNAIIVNDYDETSSGITGTVQTFDVESGQSLGGGVLFNGKDTLFRAVFENVLSFSSAIHRIEISQNPGDGIEELNTLEPGVETLLRPVAGESQLKFNLSGTTLITECVIKGDSVTENTDYKLSARIFQEVLEVFLTFETVLQGSFTPIFDVVDDSNTPTWVDTEGNSIKAEQCNFVYSDASEKTVEVRLSKSFNSEVDVIIPVNGVEPNRQGMALIGTLDLGLLNLRNFTYNIPEDNNFNSLDRIIYPSVIKGDILAGQRDPGKTLVHDFSNLTQLNNAPSIILHADANNYSNTDLLFVPPTQVIDDPIKDFFIGAGISEINYDPDNLTALDLSNFTNITEQIQISLQTDVDIILPSSPAELELIVLRIFPTRTQWTGTLLDLNDKFPNAGGLLEVTGAQHDAITLPQGTGSYSRISLINLSNITSLNFKNTGLNERCDINIGRAESLTDFDLSNVFPDIAGMGLDVSFGTGNFVDGINIDCSSQVTFWQLAFSLCNDINTLDLTNVVVNDAFSLTRTKVTTVTFGTVLDPDVFTFANQTQYNGVFPLGDKIRSPEINIWGNALNQANIDGTLNSLLTNIANMPPGAKTLSLGNPANTQDNAAPSGLDANGNIPANPTPGTGAYYIKQLGDNHNYTITYWDDVNLTDKTYS